MPRWRRLAVPCLVAGVNLAITLALQASIGTEPGCGDEYAYIVSAEIFSRGALSVPSPEPRAFFDVMHVVNDGRFYGKYPPGWPALLALGFLAGLPWLVNPLAGAAVVFAVHALARRRFDLRVADAAATLLLASPFLTLNAASWFSHPACLLALLLFADAAFAWESRPSSRTASAAMGVALGAAFLMRPFTAMAVAVAPAASAALGAWRRGARRDLFAGAALAGLGFGVFVLALLAYNRAQTGDPFTQPFEVYMPWDRPGLPDGLEGWVKRARSHVGKRLLDLGWWMPLAPLVAVAAWRIPRRAGAAAGPEATAGGAPPPPPPVEETRRVRVLLLAALSLLAAYFAYWAEGGFRYGPRYVFEASGFVVVAAGLVLARAGRAGAALLAVLVVANAMVLRHEAAAARATAWSKGDLQRQIEAAGLANAIVFLRTGSGGALMVDLPRNGIDFDRPVLIVRDRGPGNLELLRARPGREAWAYAWDRTRGRGVLTRMPPPPSSENRGTPKARP